MYTSTTTHWSYCRPSLWRREDMIQKKDSPSLGERRLRLRWYHGVWPSRDMLRSCRQHRDIIKNIHPTCVHICVCASEYDEQAHMYTNTYSEFWSSAKPFNPSQYPSTRLNIPVLNLQLVMDTQLICQTH